MKKIAAIFVCLAVLMSATVFVASAEDGDGNSSVIDEDLGAGNDGADGEAANPDSGTTDPEAPDDASQDTEETEDPASPASDDGVTDPDNTAGTGEEENENPNGDDSEDAEGTPSDSEEDAPAAPDSDVPDPAEETEEDPVGDSEDSTDEAADPASPALPEDTDAAPGNPEADGPAADTEGSGPAENSNGTHDKDSGPAPQADGSVPQKSGCKINQVKNPVKEIRKPAPATPPVKPPAKKADACERKTTEEKEKLIIPPERLSKANSGGMNIGLYNDTIMPRLIIFYLYPIEPPAPPKVEESLICFLEDFIFGKDMILHNNSIGIENVTLANNTTDRNATQTITADILDIKGRENCNVTLAILHVDAPPEIFEQTIDHTMAMEKSNTVNVHFTGLKLKGEDLILIAVTSPDEIKLYAAEIYKAVFSEYRKDWVLFHLTD